jgi:hypothetical protein
MAGDEQGAARPDPAEERLLRRLRIVAGFVILGLIVLLATVDTLGRLLIDRDFHASEVILGTLIGALLVLAGLETVTRLPGGKK